MPLELRRNDRGALPTLPPAHLIEQREIRAAVESMEAAQAAAEVAYRAVVELENTRPAAVAKDRELHADALQAGKGDPGEPNATEHDERTHAAQRKVEASRIVAKRTVDALRDVIAEHAATWATLAGKQLKAANRKWLAVDRRGRESPKRSSPQLPQSQPSPLAVVGSRPPAASRSGAAATTWLRSQICSMRCACTVSRRKQSRKLSGRCG